MCVSECASTRKWGTIHSNLRNKSQSKLGDGQGQICWAAHPFLCYKVLTILLMKIGKEWSGRTKGFVDKKFWANLIFVLLTILQNFSFRSNWNGALSVQNVSFQSKGAFINDVMTQNCPPPSCHTKITILLTPLKLAPQKIVPPPPYLHDIIYEQPLRMNIV